MKKNTKRILGLFLAAAILSTEIPVYAAGTDSVLSTEMEAPAADVENGAAQDADNMTGSADAEGNTDDTAPADENQNAEGNVDDTAPADKSQNAEGNVDDTAPADKSQNVEGTVTTDDADSQNKDTQNTEKQNTEIVQGEIITDENNDEVEIKENDKPYLSLGADLSDEQRAVVLSIMGIDPAKLDSYDVSYVTNSEEHQYLDAYIDPAKIGSKSWSSVVIVEREKGNGLNISTNNISYCTVGMYKNALTTAGVTDADIIVAGPQRISGTAALVGILKAYQEMTGETIDDSVVDAALNELVITGELADSIAGLSNEEVEEFIAYIKAVIAENDLSDEESINEAIDDACDKYGVTLTDEERQKIVDLLLKITSLGIDLNGLVDYASSLYNSFKNGGSVGGDGFFASVGNFFANVFSTIGDFFKNLFS